MAKERNRTISVNMAKSGGNYKIIVAKNQKVIQIHRIKNSINFTANQSAMQILTSNAYVLYMYLLMHENHRIWALSSKDVFNKTPLTEKTYPKAVVELILKGYLTAGIINIGGDKKYYDTYKEEAYHLWESPDMKESWEKENPDFVLTDAQYQKWKESHPEIFNKFAANTAKENGTVKKTRKRKNDISTLIA